MKKPQTISRKDAFPIYEWMKTHITPLETKTHKGQPMCAWKDGWDDHRAASHHGTSAVVIRNLRLESFGHIKGAAEPSPLERRLTDIENYLTSKNANWREQI